MLKKPTEIQIQPSLFLQELGKTVNIKPVWFKSMTLAKTFCLRITTESLIFFTLKVILHKHKNPYHVDTSFSLLRIPSIRAATIRNIQLEGIQASKGQNQTHLNEK